METKQLKDRGKKLLVDSYPIQTGNATNTLIVARTDPHEHA